MGLFRKMASASTLGAIDFKSDKERTATYTKKAAKEAKEQTKIMRQQAAQGQPLAPPPTYPAPAPPGPSASSGYYVPPPSQRNPSPGPAPVPPAPVPAAPPQDDLMTQLAKLAEMKQAGLLNDDEFAAAKAKLLG